MAEIDLHQKKIDAAWKAIDALSRYKFIMFGYWAAMWVHLNQIDGRKEANPFKHLVQEARHLKGGFFPGVRSD